jgi:hypothetical protein
MRKERAAAVFVVGATMLYANRERLANRALNNRMPMMCGPHEIRSGGLVDRLFDESHGRIPASQDLR